MPVKGYCYVKYFFQCDSGGCVPADSVCDFQLNCLDESDEMYCGDLLCPDGQLSCTDNKECFDKDRHYHGIEDCMDTSDEYIEQSTACPGFQCRDLTCIPSTLTAYIMKMKEIL